MVGIQGPLFSACLLIISSMTYYPFPEKSDVSVFFRMLPSMNVYSALPMLVVISYLIVDFH